MSVARYSTKAAEQQKGCLYALTVQTTLCLLPATQPRQQTNRRGAGTLTVRTMVCLLLATQQRQQTNSTGAGAYCWVWRRGSQLGGECGGLELLPGGAHQAGQGRARQLTLQQGCTVQPRLAGMSGHAYLLHLHTSVRCHTAQPRWYLLLSLLDLDMHTTLTINTRAGSFRTCLFCKLSCQAVYGVQTMQHLATM